MPRNRGYLLTPTARAQFREAKAWSFRRWGPELTEKYFQDLHDAAEWLAKNYRTFRTREELAGGTGLRLHPVREHYMVYEPLGQDEIVVIALIRQGRDIPRILSKGEDVLRREVEALRAKLGIRPPQRND